ncbi:MAG: hypothetical protein ACI82A_002579 [Candidatus Azotimanducaceae bacterium]|jgi:hypothetical protein
MELARDEMAFRKRYQQLVIDRQLTTVFRPGNRIFPKYRGYKLNEVISARIIEKPGCDESNVAPLFNDIKMPLQIAAIETININDLRSAHFEGSSPDVQTVEQLVDHLESIYNQSVGHFDNEITRIGFTYLRVAQTAQQSF